MFDRLSEDWQEVRIAAEEIFGVISVSVVSPSEKPRKIKWLGKLFKPLFKKVKSPSSRKYKATIGTSIVVVIEPAEKGQDRIKEKIPVMSYGQSEGEAVWSLIDLLLNPQFIFPLKLRFGLIEELRRERAEIYFEAQPAPEGGGVKKYLPPMYHEGTGWVFSEI